MGERDARINVYHREHRECRPYPRRKPGRNSKAYIGYDVSGMSFSNVVTRDNCIEGQGYCVCRTEGMSYESRADTLGRTPRVTPACLYKSWGPHAPPTANVKQCVFLQRQVRVYADWHDSSIATPQARAWCRPKAQSTSLCGYTSWSVLALLRVRIQASVSTASLRQVRHGGGPLHPRADAPTRPSFPPNHVGRLLSRADRVGPPYPPTLTGKIP